MNPELSPQQLAELASFQETILASAASAIVATDLNGVITLCNPAARQLLGYSEDELVGRMTPAAFHVADELVERARKLSHELGRAVEPGFEVLVAKARGGTPETREWTYVRKDGSRFPVLLSVSAMRDASGTLIGYLGIARDITERKQLESERDRLFKLSLDLLCIAKTDGYFKRLNPAFSATLGWSEEELLARPFLDFIHPEDKAATVREVEKLAAGQPTIHFENRYQCKDGSWKVLSWRCNPQPDGTLYATARDVTEQKESEAKFARFTAIVASSEDAIMSKTLDGVVTSWNEAAQRMFGYSEQEMIGATMVTLFPPDRYDEELEILARINAGERIEHFETVRVRKDGMPVPVSATISPVRDVSGDITGASIILRDITEKKRAEQRTAANIKELADFKAALDEHAIVAITDAHGKITYANDKFCAISKYAREELVGQDHRIINSGHHPKEFIRDLWETIKAGRVWKGELKNRAKDGSFYWVETTIVPFLDAGGRPVQFIAIRADITERKEAEEQIKGLNCELKQRATLLEQANQELESFSYSVSHDLRAPLRHVHGYVEMLTKATEGQLSEKAQRYLKTINDASAEMGMLIDDLLAFSRMGRAEMREAVVDIDRMVADTVSGLEMATKDRDITWKIAPLPPALGDAAMLRQVFSNLISNSVKYSSGRNTAEIEIGYSGLEDGRHVYFVRDNGAGFDMQYAHKLFGVFQRLHRSDEFEGTGIGLATVKRILTRHGERVWAEGEEGVGATFYFTLKPSNED